MTLNLTNERLLSLAADGERMATEAKEHADRRYYADVAALTRAVLEARAVVRRAGDYNHFSGRPAGATASMLDELAAIIGESK